MRLFFFFFSASKCDNAVGGDLFAANTAGEEDGAVAIAEEGAELESG
jgi:hypothetical protein